MFGQTHIVWDDVFEEYKCAKCGAVLYYQLGFKACPYCRRKIVKNDNGKFSLRKVISRKNEI